MITKKVITDYPKMLAEELDDTVVMIVECKEKFYQCSVLFLTRELLSAVEMDGEPFDIDFENVN